MSRCLSCSSSTVLCPYKGNAFNTHVEARAAIPNAGNGKSNIGCALVDASGKHPCLLRGRI